MESTRTPGSPEHWVDEAVESLWPEGRESGWTLESVAAMMRAAYGQGYVDSLSGNSPVLLPEAQQRYKYFWSQLPV